MSLLTKLRNATHERRATEEIPVPGGGYVQYLNGRNDPFADSSGPSMESVAGYPPVGQALQMLAGDLAKMPVMVYEVKPEGRYPKPAHRLLELIGLFGKPNDTETTFDLLFDWFFHALLWGRSALYVERIGPEATGLIPLLPDRTFPVYMNGRRYFETEVSSDTAERAKKVYLPNDDVLYLEGFNIDGLHPENPVRVYRRTFENALNAQDFTSKFFANGSQQGGILMVPPGASETAIVNTENAVSQRSAKSNWFKTLILKDGFRWQNTTSTLRDATAVELDEASARHVARIYNIPPSKLGLKDTVSYNSLDQDNRQYIDSCLSSWLIQARSQFHRKLVLPSKQRTIQVDYIIDELLWADPVSKASVAEKGLAGNWLDINTVRAWFGQAPQSDGDAPSTSRQEIGTASGTVEPDSRDPMDQRDLSDGE